MTPEDIARQRHHHDIVELLTDWSLGCNSPKAAPAPTLPPQMQKSPLASMASPSTTTSPVEIHNSSEPSLVTHYQPARPKTTINRAPGTRPRSTASRSNNNNAKRKRKKARPDEEVYPPIMSTSQTRPRTTASRSNNNNAKRKRKKARPDEEVYPPTMSTSQTRPRTTASRSNNNNAKRKWKKARPDEEVCPTISTDQPQVVSTNCVPITNDLSPLESMVISPADSTTLSPLHAPNSLDTQPPSPIEPLDILSPDDLVGLEGVQIRWDDLPLDDIDPFNDPADMSMAGFPPSMTIAPLVVVDHIVPTTSDCITLVSEVFLIFHRISRSCISRRCERAAKRRTRVAKRRERKTSGYFGLESHFHADASCQTRQFDNSKWDQWKLSNHVLISC